MQRSLLLRGLLILVVVVIAAFYFRLLLWMAFQNVGSYDFPIFYAAAQHFIKTGQLYSTNLVQYYPAAPIYKFPPLFASVLISLIRLGASEHTLDVVCFWLQLAIYFSVIFTTTLGCRHWLGICDRNRIFYYHCFSIILACTCYPFIETLMPLQLETYNLVLILLTAVALLKRRPVLAGLFVSIGFMLKLYPVLLLLYFIVRREWRAVGGFLIGVMAITAFTIATTGFESHQFYFTQALPTMLNEYPSEALTNISLAANLRHFYDDYQPFFSGWDELPIRLIFRCIFLVFLLPVLWLAWRSPRHNTAAIPSLILLECSLFSILMLMGLIDSWDNYQLLLLVPALVFLGRIVSEPQIDFIALVVLLLAWFTMWMTAYPVTRDLIPADYFYRYVVFRGLTTYLVFYCGFRLYSRLHHQTQ